MNDLNDVVPKLCGDKFESTISIPEKSSNGTFIVKIEGKDDDRTCESNMNGKYVAASFILSI